VTIIENFFDLIRGTRLEEFDGILDLLLLLGRSRSFGGSRVLGIIPLVLAILAIVDGVNDFFPVR
jgi:hypothetical protein